MRGREAWHGRHQWRANFAAMEARRMVAADLFVWKASEANIARQLGVVHQTVSDRHE